ncbi:unnamed protein product [Blepharisma stoltei]|uniref:Uncharacterized protein n=1 Tax=Blepharisma stoltei TaxID=1481888 RepID=A0AAU9JTD7_9CILI|nr:unnamed protein product [Blepharisma stoltei]
MSYIKKALAKESPKNFNKLSMTIKDLNSDDYSIASRLSRRSTGKSSSSNKSFDMQSATKRQPLSKRNYSSEGKHKEPIRLHLNLKSISKQCTNSMSNPLRISMNLMKAHEFIDPEVETTIPSAHEYLSNTPKIKHHIPFIDDLNSTKIDQAYYFNEDLQLSSYLPFDREKASFESLIKKKGPLSKEHVEKELSLKYKTSRKIVLVPRNEEKELPASVVVCEGNAIKLYDINFKD